MTPDDRAYLQARKLASAAVVALLSSVAINATGEATVGPVIGAAGVLLGLYAAHKLGRASGVPTKPLPPLRDVAGR